MTSQPISQLPVFAIVGSDITLRNDALKSVLAAISADDPTADVSRVDGGAAASEFDPVSVLDDLRMPSLFGARRVVIVDSAEELISKFRQPLEKYCSDPATSGVLILLCRSLPANQKIYKAISKVGKVIPCELPKRNQLGGWLSQRAREKFGKKIDRQAAAQLCDQIGDTPGLLDAELAKLASYVGDRDQIQVADVEALCGQVRERKVFAVYDAMSNGDTRSAFREWEHMISHSKVVPEVVIGGLAVGPRRLLDAHCESARGGNLLGHARSCFTSVDRLQQRLARLDVRLLMNQQRDLLRADLACKTGRSTAERSVEKFIVKHSTGMPGR
ncbi:MAG: DNA polymerase III subunit delta [Planctomycetota bacterium]|jgi:DNA polymerase-3 subunit delta